MTIDVTPKMLAQLASLNIAEELAKPEDVTFSVKVDRDWTWLKFSDGDAVRENEPLRKAMRDVGGRFSGKRGAWYFKRLLTQVELLNIAEHL